MVFKLARISLLRVLRILPVTISELTLETVLARDKDECLNSFSRVTCIDENINTLIYSQYQYIRSVPWVPRDFSGGVFRFGQV